MGDFNAHLQGRRFIKVTDACGRHLFDMMHNHSMLSLNTLPTCVGATASFVSYGDLYESLIDHILLPIERLDTVLSCKILDDDVLNISRHLPVLCSVSVPPANLDTSQLQFPSHVKWDKLHDEAKHLYKSELENQLTKFSITEGCNAAEYLNKNMCISLIVSRQPQIQHCQKQI